MIDSLLTLWKSTGLFKLFNGPTDIWVKTLIMYVIVGVLVYLAIKKQFEPLLLLPIAIGQTLICYLAAIPLGLTFSINIIYAIIGIIPMAVFNIALGLLCGSLFGVKQVGGICGALLTNLSAWLSGVWFDLKFVGGFFAKIANVLPFVHAAEMEKALFNGNFELAITHIMPIILYSVVITAIAVLSFLRQMKKQ